MRFISCCLDVEGCGRLSLDDGLLDVSRFCVCKLGGSLERGECKFGGGASGLSDSCLIRVISNA
jgi:hypothetical protein